MTEDMTETPLPLSLLLADRIYQDRDSGKWVVAGIFSTIFVPSLPRTFDTLEVFFQVTNISTQVDLHLRIEHADGQTVVLDVGGPIQARDPLEVIARKVMLRNVPIRKAGKYWVMLKSGEEILTQVPLHVVHRPPKQQQQQSGQQSPEPDEPIDE